MTIPGPNMHRQLMDGYKDAQSRLEQMRTGLNEFDTRRGELGDDRSDALVDLAEHYLPDLSRESIEQSWIEVRSNVSRILLRRDEHRERLQRPLNEFRDKRNLLEDRLFELNESINRADAEQSRLADETEATLAKDETFARLSGQAAMAEAALERAEANLDEIEQDAAKKLPAYRESSLFSYLKKRNFGTSQYTTRGLTRRVDRWLAKFIDYNKAKQNFDFLVKTPDQMRKIIADDRDALDTVMEELEQQRDAVAKRVGLTAAIKHFEQLSNDRERLLTQLHETEEESAKLESELTDLEDPKGSYYREAVSEFRDMLERFDSRTLESRASRTPSLTDDQIVARIVGVEEKLEDLDGAARRHHDDLMHLQECINALGRVLQRFRAAKFDGTRSHFLPDTDALGAIHRAKGERDIEDLWQQLRKAQRWGPTLGEKVAIVASHPATQVLIGAMAQAAGSAMRDHARRAGRRRYNSRQRREPWFGDSSDNYRRW